MLDLYTWRDIVEHLKSALVRLSYMSFEATMTTEMHLKV